MSLRKIKYLYIDDEENKLIADCEGGNVVLSVALNGTGKVPPAMTPQHNSLNGIGSSDHHEKTGDYEVYALTESKKNTPPANNGHLGRIVRQRDGQGSPTTVLICVENSNNEYEWVEIGVST